MPQKAVFVGSFNDVRQIPADNRIHIAFAGRSNVGKSTLLNRLVGQKKLARTSKTPGRTQSINFFLIDDRYYFVDLPGFGYAKVPEKARQKWGQLVDKYLNAVDNLLGLIYLFDCRREPDQLDLMMIDWLEEKKKKFAFVLTKTDKLSRNELAKKAREIENIFRITPIPFSNISGIGKNELLAWIDMAVRT